MKSKKEIFKTKAELLIETLLQYSPRAYFTTDEVKKLVEISRVDACGYKDDLFEKEKEFKKKYSISEDEWITNPFYTSNETTPGEFSKWTF